MNRLAAVLPVLFLACGTTTESNFPNGSFVISGTMEFLNIETGCWILVTDDGKRYEPTGVSAHDLFINGLRVTVRVRTVSGVASVCQAGTLIEVLDIVDSQEG